MTATRIWTVAAVALIAAILGLGWLLGVAPLLAQASTADSERANVEAQNAAHEASLTIMKADFERLDEIEAELAGLQRSIPPGERVTAFASFVESVVSAHGLSLRSIVAGELPFGATDAEVAGATAGLGGSALSIPAGTVFALPVTIGLEGEPEAVMDAVRALQTGERLFLVGNVTFSRGGVGSTPGATVVGYIFLLTDRQLAATPEEAATAPEPGPGTTYQVPDLDAALPEWLGGEGQTPGETPAPDPSSTPTPSP